jgi:hypothetical protein
VVWFALNEDRPLFAFGGLWTTFNGDRGTKSKPVPGPHQVYGFLTTAPNAIVEPIHPKAMPHDVEGNGLVGVAATAFHFKIAVAGIDRVTQCGSRPAGNHGSVKLFWIRDGTNVLLGRPCRQGAGLTPAEA